MFPDLSSFDSGAKRSGLRRLHVCHWSVGASPCVTRGLASPSVRQATVDPRPSVPALASHPQADSKVTVHPRETESDTEARNAREGVCEVAVTMP